MRITRHGRFYLLETEQWLAKPPEALWAFFSDPFNLETISPDYLRFHVKTPRPIAMGLGTRIDYRLRIHGLPVSWRSEICEWDPPWLFTDQQLKGPYSSWRHRHLFEPRDGGSLCKDEVRYRLPGGGLGRIAHRLLVKGDLEGIFAFRAAKLAGLIGSRAEDRRCDLAPGKPTDTTRPVPADVYS